MIRARLAVWFGVFLVLVSQAFAVSFVSFSGSNIPTQIYETTNSNFTFQVSNGLFSLNSLDNVSIGASGFSLVSIIDIVGWDETGFVNYHTTTNAISNWGSQNFGFAAKANQVTQDTTYNWPVTITDTAGDASTFSYQVTVLNDATPPVIFNAIPTSGSFIQGTANQLFSIGSVDPETGVAGSNVFKSVNCSGNYTSASLSSSGSTWSTNLDLTPDPEAVSICYYFDSTNNGGATATTPTYNTRIDRTPPTINLNSPAAGALLSSSNVVFDFNATDNLATTLNCNLTIDSNQNPMTIYGQTTYNAVLSDGQHSWSVSCTDGAGWSTASGTNTFTVDTQGPQINITQIQTQFRGANVPLSADIFDAGVGVNPSSVTFTITDPNVSPTAVSVSQSGNVFSGTYPTSVSSALGTYYLFVAAADNIGNSANATANFLLTYSYLLGINANPSQVNPSDPANNITNDITITGTVTFDDGSAVPENSLTLTVPDSSGSYTNVTANIASNQFAYISPAPTVPGNYQITAWITPSNGYTFSANTNVFVGQFCGDTSCNNGESCGSCASDCGSCPPSSGNSGGGGSSGGKKGGSSGRPTSGGLVYQPPAIVPQKTDGANGVVEKPQPKDDGKNGVVEQPSSSAVIQPAETPGIGAGIGLFSNLKIRWWVIAVIAGMLMTLYIVGRRTKRKTNKFNIEMTEYLESRYRE